MLISKNKVYFSIKDIAEKAGINRKTFYLHFNCIEDLYRDLEIQTEDNLLKILELSGFFDNNFTIEVLLRSILELIHSNEKLYSKLLIADTYKFLFRNVKNKVKEKILPMINAENNLKSEMYAEFFCSGLLKLFRVWAEKKDEMSETELIESAYTIINYGLTGIIKENNE